MAMGAIASIWIAAEGSNVDSVVSTPFGNKDERKVVDYAIDWILHARVVNRVWSMLPILPGLKLSEAVM